MLILNSSHFTNIKNIGTILIDALNLQFHIIRKQNLFDQQQFDHPNVLDMLSWLPTSFRWLSKANGLVLMINQAPM